MKNFILKTLRGDIVKDGIFFTNGLVIFSPTWGMTRRSQDFLGCCTEKISGIINSANICKTENGIVFRKDASSDTVEEVVLIQEYSPGSGAKRWPGFSVLKEGIEVLASSATSGGSGREKWLLAISPLGWSEEIAYRFLNDRDVSDQEVSVGRDFLNKREEKDPSLENLAELWGAKIKKS